MTPAPRRTVLRQFILVFCLWTLVALAGALSNYLLQLALGREAVFWSDLRRPLIEHWIWAAFTPLVFLVSKRYPLTRRPLVQSAAVHAVVFVSLSFLHCVLAAWLGSRLAFQVAGFSGSPLELRFLEEFYSDIWMYWPLVCIQALIESRARTIERETRAAQLEARLAGSQLALLRAQIQPHFLFNTLHSISALLRVDPRAAEDMVADLAEILRRAFADTAGQETTLRSELELVRCYLRIQQCRFGERLQVTYTIAQDALDAALPALLLQSLVENAVIHGATPLNRPVSLVIRASREADRLLLAVEDDGAGLPTDFTTGVGLSNARERLQQLYAQSQSFAIDGAPDRGCRVAVHMPFRSVNVVDEGQQIGAAA